MSKQFAEIAREVLSLDEIEGSINLSKGVPAEQLIDTELIQEVTQEILRNNELFNQTLSYSIPDGYADLRALFLERFKETKIEEPACLITAGAQGAIDLIGKKINKDESIANHIIVENPTYTGTILSLEHTYNIQVSSFELLPEFCEHSFEFCVKSSRSSFIYLIPHNQNPTGKSYSEQEKEKIVNIARKYNKIIIEDDPYSEIRFTNAPCKKIHEIYENTIYIGTVSKTISPGLRVGYIVANSELINELKTLQLLANINNNVFSQIQTYLILKHELFDEKQKEKLEIYKEKKNEMIEAIKKHFPSSIKYANPDGGFFIWLELPELLDGEEIYEDCMQQNLGIFPGHIFCTDLDKPKNYIRLSYSTATIEEIKEGIRKLGVIIQKRLENLEVINIKRAI